MSILQPVYLMFRWLRLTGADIPEQGILGFPRRAPSRSHPGCSTDNCSPRPGETAPDFTLSRIGGGNCSLSDYRGRRVLLVFVDARSRRRHEVAPELNRLHRSRKLVVIVIIRGTRRDAALWADETLADFPVLVSSDRVVSTAYGVSDSRCAFEIDEQGRIVESGIITPQPSPDSPSILRSAPEITIFRIGRPPSPPVLKIRTETQPHVPPGLQRTHP